MYLVTQYCLTLGNPMDCSPLGSSVHGTSQARRLERIAIPFRKWIFPIQGLNLCLMHGQAAFFTVWAPWGARYAQIELLLS